jgi:hypothetical protein
MKTALIVFFRMGRLVDDKRQVIDRGCRVAERGCGARVQIPGVFPID